MTLTVCRPTSQVYRYNDFCLSFFFVYYLLVQVRAVLPGELIKLVSGPLRIEYKKYKVLYNLCCFFKYFCSICIYH